MFLQKLELIGFKSFAEKTELDFLPPKASTKGITAIVGPNGSGKSNIADALRWVLGEQSVKLLRGKKAEDVIFSGSEKRARSGFAEVTLQLDNEDGKLPVDSSEASISRRVYRDGQSEYLINKNSVRLADIQLLLAQARMGGRSYSVIGQGMVDSILSATPQERKEFFDEAAGVRQFQIKRHQATLKINAARDNLQQAMALAAEIEPRLRSLSRQVRRLEQRGELEQELHALLHEYYGTLWLNLKSQIDARLQSLAVIEKEWKEKEAVLGKAQSALSNIETEDSSGGALEELQKRYHAILEERDRLREREMRLRSEIEISEQVSKRAATPLPLSKIIEEIDALSRRGEHLLESLRKASSVEQIKALAEDAENLVNAAAALRDRLERPAPEPKAAHSSAADAELKKIAEELVQVNKKILNVQSEMQSYVERERQNKEKLFGLQRGLQEKISAAQTLERRINDERIELAKLETRREVMEQEMAAELGEKAEHAKQNFTPNGHENPEAVFSQIQKLKYQLQLIGGIDPEAVKEYEETKDRHEFLETQIADLNKAIADLERVAAELDMTIKARSGAEFRNLNRGFDRYFKMLFGGGRAELMQIRGEEAEESEEGESERRREGESESDRIVGVDIQASPPGKKIKNIAMLSGGERALVSIALICAIMDTNPPPFIVLDEVDAALDESNAGKFAAILEKLSERTQFIIITHNRYTMRKANVLYGVTMRQDGTSLLLSVNLDEADAQKNKRKEKMTV